MYSNQINEQIMKLTVDVCERVESSIRSTLHDCDVCGLTPLPIGHPHCLECESPTLLKKCEECGDYFCSTPNGSSDCFRWHECAQVDGPNRYDVTRG